jgi:hypothetical membrane protein
MLISSERRALSFASSSRLSAQVALGFGIALPFLYYGSQIVAAPFFPDYSFITQAASLLGSDLSSRPAIFNTGAIATGIATLIAGFGFLRSFQCIGASPVLTWMTFIALFATGIGCLWSGCFPLPDPRHAGHPAVLVAMISLPFLLTATLWKQRDAQLLKTFLLATLVLLVVMIPIMSGITGMDTRSYGGLFQRVFAFTVFPPIAMCSFYLARRIGSVSQ